jgi:transposase
MPRVSRVRLHLSEAEVKEKIRTASNFRRQQKWLIIYNALVDPRTAAQIAQHTGTTVRTVHQVISDYNRLGASAIETPGSGGRRRCYLSTSEEQELLDELKPKAKRGELTTKAEVKKALEQKVGHKVHKTTVYRLLQRHQWRKLKPRPRHPKANPEEQEEFKATFEQQVQQILQQRHPNDTRPVLIMTSDEGRFGRTGELAYCWCPPGDTRPTLSRQQVRQYIYAYAAIAPSLGMMCCLILPYANTKMMNLFLRQVSQEFAEYFIILQLDRASWHRAKSLKIPENIRLLTQPPYSPEVMPVEHLWEEIREKHFDNHIFKSLDAVEDTLCKALRQLIAQPERLRSMSFFPHLRITL